MEVVVGCAVAVADVVEWWSSIVVGDLGHDDEDCDWTSWCASCSGCPFQNHWMNRDVACPNHRYCKDTSK